MFCFIITIDEKNDLFLMKEESTMTEKRHDGKLALLLLLVPLVCIKVMWLKKMWASVSKSENMGHCMHGNRMGHCAECKKMKTEEGTPS